MSPIIHSIWYGVGFYLIVIISFNILLISVFKDNKNIDKFFNFILLLVLIFLEPDGFYFHETYDPLLYIVFLLLINSQQFLLFVEKLNFKNLIILFLFVIIYYCLSIIKYLFFFVPQIWKTESQKISHNYIE